MQDNDPKHTSNHAKAFLLANNVNWWKTRAELPDMNPIENLWHELKIKPTTKEALVDGVKKFWESLKCKKYIGHLKKVLPCVIELDGRATGN